MGNNSIGAKLAELILRDFENFKHDLYCAMIERCRLLLKSDAGLLAMITQQSFMFNSRYEKARERIIRDNCWVQVLHLGANAFEEINGEVVQTCTFIFSSTRIHEYSTLFIDLQSAPSEDAKRDAFIQIKNSNSQINTYRRNMRIFLQVPNSNVAYWLSDALLNALITCKKLGDYAETRHGLVTGNGDLFMRLWFEVPNDEIGFLIKQSDNVSREKYTWFPYNKGGTMRRWYGNNEYVVNWKNDGYAIRTYRDKTSGRIKSSNYNNEYNFCESISWTDLTTGLFSARYSFNGTLFDTSGPALFCNTGRIQYLLGFLNSKVMQSFIALFCTGLHYSPGSVAKVPIIIGQQDDVDCVVSKCFAESRADWDAFETSWDFKKHPLV